MKKFVKIYVGKGKCTSLGIIKVHLLVSELLKYAHQFNDQQYVNIEIAKLKAPDNFGRDYTVYVNNLVDVAEKEATEETEETALPVMEEPKMEKTPAVEKKAKKAGKKAEAMATSDLPF